MNWLKLLWLKIQGYRERKSIVLTGKDKRIIKVYEGVRTILPLGTFTLHESISVPNIRLEGSSWSEIKNSKGNYFKTVQEAIDDLDE